MEFRNKRTIVTLIFMLLLSAVSVHADDYLAQLKPNQKIYDFRTVNLYENSSGKITGARFISDKYGFIIDLMKIESVPQGYFWAKSIPTSSKGEPHACEHLLLGKGNRGRYVAALEDMSLTSSTAGTGQVITGYHFNTTAGAETFFDIFEAKLNALINPDYTDEEIKREICNIGVVEDTETGELSIDEKGTVYTEMVSAFQNPWYHTWGTLNKMVYGDRHALSFNSGGKPEEIRTMTVDDMRSFQKEAYHLANMGAIVSIPNDIPVDDFLKKASEALPRCQSHEDSSPTPGIKNINFAPTTNGPMGEVRMVRYPSANAEDPGYLLYAWPAYLKLDKYDRMILDIFLNGFAQGQTSQLYNAIVNSETRKIDIGCQSVGGGFDSDMDVSIYFALNGMDNKYVTKPMLDSVLGLIRGELIKVMNYADGSEELKEFNDKLANRLIDSKKQTISYLNSPPMFGFRRGPASGWRSIMADLEDDTTFIKSLIMKDRFAYADSVLQLDKNIWRDKIKEWRLLDDPPYMVGATPDPGIITEIENEKNGRLADYVEDFKRKYNTEDVQTAIASYKKDFDANTTELEAVKSTEKLPGFISNPPMTLDDQLNYQTITLKNGIPMVASTFENMTASNIGIAFRMEVIPESLMVYLPFIPNLFSELGVIDGNDTLKYEEMEERLRTEILSMHGFYDHTSNDGKTELVLNGRASNLDELKNLIDWMDNVLYSPYLSVENLPRINDLIDQMIQSFRNRMKGSEEDWVDFPADAYRFQDDPLFMTTNCFLTELHHAQRLKWIMTDPGEDGPMIGLILDDIKNVAQDMNRDEISKMFSELEELGNLTGEVSSLSSLKNEEVSESSLKLISKITLSMNATLADIPDDNLHDDIGYLCDEIKADLMTKPEYAIGQINHILNLVRHTDNARLYMISNSYDRETSLDMIEALVDKLDKSPSIVQEYAKNERIIDRLKMRETNLDHPTYVGLVYNGTTNGVIIFGAEMADQYDTSNAAIVNCLAGKLYSGGGPHGLFMKTWAAGLAYSNGYSYGQGSGRARYYAERCPDIAETMKFVVNEMKTAEDDPALIDYATALVFGSSRAPNRYESRGYAMAKDLAHGIEPKKISDFRKKVLDYTKNEGVYYDVKAHLEEAYGPVMIGYGQPLSESKDGNFFIIGPEAQFESLEKLIEVEEEPQPVYRLYPRDYWITM